MRLRNERVIAVGGNLVPRALVTLVQRNVKRETLGQSVSDDKILVMQFNCAGVSILTKWQRNVEEVFHDGIEFSLTKLGNPNLDCREKRDVLTVLPTQAGVANGFWQIALLSSVTWNFMPAKRR